jgi:serine/threonine-protein kinase HipA
MAIRREVDPLSRASRRSQFATCVAAAHEYLLSQADARQIIDHQIDVIETQWLSATEEVRLSATEAAQLRERQILNPFAFEDYH